ncbi:MAG: hypothetical protein BRD38_02875 [Bacteroidetes bacterium QH_9_67_14]|nr:MAG: hypothetical protein BRD38_02875 [Bacteroidetes bacterium QH_9_67_14]
MRMIYFQDVDTLEVVLREELGPVAETVDGPKENIMMDFDEEGRLVGMTIEEASRKTPFEALRNTPCFENAGAQAQQSAAGSTQPSL